MKLHTHFIVEECRDRLTAAIDPEQLALALSWNAGSKDIIGTIDTQTFRLRHRRFYGNSFAPVFFGRFTPVHNGTIIEGDFALETWVFVFMAIWFSFLGIASLGIICVFVMGTMGFVANFRLEYWAMLLVPAAILCGGYGLLKFSRWLARGEEAAIARALHVWLEAKDVEHQTEATS